MRPTTAGVTTLALAVGLAGTAPASNNQQSRATLKGLTNIVVSVDVRGVPVNTGISKDQLQTDAELNLRRSGIAVAANAASLSTGVLSLDIICATPRDLPEPYGCGVRLELSQAVTLVRRPSVVGVAVTWSSAAVAVGGSDHLADVRKVAEDLVDRFANAYLEQNPKIR